MWEDTFTGACKFRARWLLRACDLPQDALRRLRKLREESSQKQNDENPHEETRHKDDTDEVFLTPRTEDLELRMIAKPATLFVCTSEGGETLRNCEGKPGPRFTHKFCPSTGEFSVLSLTEEVIVRAKARQADATVASSGSDKEGSTTKRGSTADGWLPQKGRSLATRGRGRGRGRGGRGGPRGSSRARVTGTQNRSQSPANFPERDGSDESEAVQDPDEAWEEGDDGVSDSDSDADFESSYGSVVVSPKTAQDEDDVGSKKTARQRRSQRAAAASDSGTTALACDEEKNVSKTNRPNTHQLPRRPRAPVSRRQGPLPPRPRRLAMPPTLAQGIAKSSSSSMSNSGTSAPCAPRATPPMKTRPTTTGKGKVSPTQSSPITAMAEVERPSYVPTKRRKVTAGKALAMNTSHYPPRRTSVGKEYQAEIPDLLPPDKQDRQPPENVPRMVSYIA